MRELNKKVQSIITWIAATIAILVSVSLPLVYFFIAYQLEVAVLETHAEINARIASDAVNASPSLWQYHTERLEEFLKRRSKKKEAEVRRIVDLDGKVVAEVAQPLSPPILTRSADLLDSGVKVATIEISRSSAPLLIQTALIASFAALLGIGSFAVLRILPLRALRRSTDENSQLLDTLENRMAELTASEYRLKALHEIGVAVNSTLDVTAVLKLLMEKIATVFPEAAIQIWLLNPDTHEFERAACLNLDESEWKGRKLRGLPPLVQEAITSQLPVVVPDVRKDPRTLDPEFYCRQGIISYLGIPLIAKGEAVGDLVLLSRSAHRSLEDEIDFLATLTGHAATAIHNSQLFEATQRSRTELVLANQRLDRLLQEQTSLYAALTPLAHADSLDDVMYGLIDKFLESTGAEMALLRMQDQHKHIFVAAQRAFPRQYLEAFETVQPESAAAKVFASGTPIIATDIAGDGRFKFKAQLQVGLRSCAMLPLFVRGEVQGIIHLASREIGYFKAEQEDYLMAIARQMGIMLENRQFFDELRASKEHVEQINEILTNQAAALARSNTELEQFAYVASHDLQEPLRMIMGYTNLLSRRYKGKLDQDADEFIGFAADAAKRMHTLINDLLSYSRVGTKAKEFEPTDCEVVLAETLDSLRVAISESGAKIVHDPLPTIMADRTQIGQLMQNLIGNAVKYRDSKPPEIHVSCRHEGSDWLFSVKDNGIGIDPEYADKIFVIFQRLHNSEQYAGTGIGLAICKKIVERHGGTIWLESKQGHGAQFHFTLPQMKKSAGVLSSGDHGVPGDSPSPGVI